MSIILLIALCLYFLAVIATIPVWHLMLTRRFLHKNFRTLIFLVTSGVLIVCSLTLIVMIFPFYPLFGLNPKFHLDSFVTSIQNIPELYSDFDYITIPMVRYGGMLFHVGILFLCVERAIAVFFVSHYEKYVSTYITVLIILVVVISTAVLATIMNALVSSFSSVPILIFLVGYSSFCFIIALALMLRRRFTRKEKHSFSLQQKFQEKENSRTGPVYTSISANELITSIGTLVIYVYIGEANKTNDVPQLRNLSNILDLIDSYRFLFINVTILLNCYLWIRDQKKVLIDHATGDQYFQQLQNCWAN